MNDWLYEYQVTGEPRNKIPTSTPIDGLRATKINQSSASVPLDELSVVEQYVLGVSYFLSTGSYLLNDGTNQHVTDSLIRLMGMTQKGKVWLRDDVPALLTTETYTADTMQVFQERLEQGVTSPILGMLFLGPDVVEDNWEPMSRHRVRKDSVAPLDIHPDLSQICDFAKAISWPDKTTTLQVSGWNLAELDEPNPLIAMLLSRFQTVDLIVYPSNGKVRFINAQE